MFVNSVDYCSFFLFCGGFLYVLVCYVGLRLIMVVILFVLCWFCFDLCLGWLYYLHCLQFMVVFDWLAARWGNCFGGYVVVILGLNI